MSSDGQRGPGAGRFSENYPAARRTLRLDAWPAADRAAFERACRPGAAFDPPGPAHAWSSGTRRARRQAYGRYLNWLGRTGQLDPAEPLVLRLTPVRLAAYLAECRGLLSAVTVLQQLRELRQVLGAIASEQDWSWVTRHPAKPSRPEARVSAQARQVLFDPLALHGAALRLIDEVGDGDGTVEQDVLHRDALIVAVQCAFALRRANLAGMRLGRNLMLEHTIMRLAFQAEETKTGQAIDNLVAPHLHRYVRAYLDGPRRRLLAGRVSDAVWINRRHGPLGDGALVGLFKRMGRLLIGVPIGCHDFRRSCATAILSQDASAVATAGGVLTHRTTETTTRDYDKSGDQDARRVWDSILRRCSS